MLRIDKRPLAEEDLIDIWMYGCGKWGAAQADTYADGIESTLNSLAHSPKKHRLRKNFRPPVRIYHYVSHLIIYTIEEHSITVVRVLHKSMDIKQHL
ncbi:MAG: type II toxin-antitoxin system RelE/ParE family toxin [Cellvibrionaceae bacterium]|nr:type II toxin-antitoxin system RelE/ParE family toxin [Cellvibrionaceae bacterium]